MLSTYHEEAASLFADVEVECILEVTGDFMGGHIVKDDGAGTCE